MKCTGGGEDEGRSGDGRKYENLSLITVFVITRQGILNVTTANGLFAVYVYVSYRSQYPDKETVNRVQKKLQENNIDVNRLAEYKTDQCQQAESSTTGGSTTETLAVGMEGNLLPF